MPTFCDAARGTAALRAVRTGRAISTRATPEANSTATTCARWSAHERWSPALALLLLLLLLLALQRRPQGRERRALWHRMRQPLRPLLRPFGV